MRQVLQQKRVQGVDQLEWQSTSRRDITLRATELQKQPGLWSTRMRPHVLLMTMRPAYQQRS
eukprot:15346386-Alexandrium_andersonii.AAC.1